MIGNIISFSLGAMFGVVMMCCFIVAGDDRDDYDEDNRKTNE